MRLQDSLVAQIRVHIPTHQIPLMNGPVYFNVFNCLCVGGDRVLLVLGSFPPAGRVNESAASISARVIAVSALASASEQLTDPVFCPLADLHVENSVSQCCDPSCCGTTGTTASGAVPWNLVAVDGTNPPETEERASKPNE
jgi:hypothetical protein